MGAFFGNIIGRIISRLVMMALLVGGGQYYLAQNGGLMGVLGGGGAAASTAQPISAGLSGIAATLGIGQSAPSPYYEAQGRISQIAEQCRLVRALNGKTERTQPIPCDRARLATTHAQYSDYTLSEARIATFIYYDMDGVNIREGQADAKPGQKVGDVISLKIDRANPQKAIPL